MEGFWNGGMGRLGGCRLELCSGSSTLARSCQAGKIGLEILDAALQARIMGLVLYIIACSFFPLTEIERESF